MEHDMLGQRGTFFFFFFFFFLGGGGGGGGGGGAKWNRDLGQNILLWQTHARIIYWEGFDEFTSAHSVLSELGKHNFNASMVVRMNNGLNESQIVQLY